MQEVATDVLRIPFEAVCNPYTPKKLGSVVHVFTLTYLAGPPRHRPARMSLCSRFSAAPDAFQSERVVELRREAHTCPRCWDFLKQYLSF